jgi:hypothetical protein
MPPVPSPKPVVSIRKPPSDPIAVERFVTDGAAVAAAPENPLAAPTTPARGRGLVVRTDGRIRRRMTVYLPPELAREISVRCAGDGRDVSDLVTDALTAYIAHSAT